MHKHSELLTGPNKIGIHAAKVLKDSPDHVQALADINNCRPTAHCFQFIKFSHWVEIAEKVLLIKERDHEMM